MLEIGGMLFLLLLWYIFTKPSSAEVDPVIFSAEEIAQIEAVENKKLAPTDTLSSKQLDWIYNNRSNEKVSAGPLAADEVLDLFQRRGEKPTLYPIELSKDEMALIKHQRGNPIVSAAILPSPGSVLSSFKDLYYDNDLIVNTCYSIGYNLSGYVVALLLALPLGFLIGLFPFFRGSFQRPIDAFRYVPLPAVIGIFIGALGLGTSLVVYFLAFGILIYLLPVIVQRIDEVKEVYLKTVYTLGATDWQTIKTVYIPSVMSRLSDDIRVLTAISWTYIVIAEILGGSKGIGVQTWLAQRLGRMDKVYALLLIIVIIGILQDKIFAYLDKEFFPFKYQNKNKYQKVEEKSTFDVILDYAMKSLVWVLLAVYLLLFFNEFFGNVKILTHFFGETVWVIHFIMVSVIFYKGYKFFKPKLKPSIG